MTVIGCFMNLGKKLFLCFILLSFSSLLTAEASKALVEKAQAGDADAQFKLAEFYILRNESVDEIRLALDLYIASSKQGHAEAQFVLGKWYLQISHDRDAIPLLIEASKQGHMKATLTLMSSITPRNSPDEIAEMIRLVRGVADSGNLEAQIGLERMYWVGKIVPKDKEEAGVWLEMAAEQGHMDSQSTLAFRYLHGHGVVKNDKKAAEWYKK